MGIASLHPSYKGGHGAAVSKAKVPAGTTSGSLEPGLPSP